MGVSWGVPPPLCKPFCKQTNQNIQVTIWWVPCVWPSVTPPPPSPLKNPGYALESAKWVSLQSYSIVKFDCFFYFPRQIDWREDFQQMSEKVSLTWSAFQLSSSLPKCHINNKTTKWLSSINGFPIARGTFLPLLKNWKLYWKKIWGLRSLDYSVSLISCKFQKRRI